MLARLTGLWRHPDFLKLWAGETISLVGTQVTFLALPLTAVLVLGARPVEMGLLAAVSSAPYLLFGLIAGVWVDRLPRRPILVGANLGRGLLLGLVPASALLGLLAMPQLYAVAFGVGLLTVFFDVSYQAFLPGLVRRDQLVEGNSKLEASYSFAQIAGTSLGGALVQLLTAPVAIVVDAVSFFVAAASLVAIPAPTPPTAPTRSARRGALSEVGIGLRWVFGSPILRSIAACTATFLLASSAYLAVYVLFLVRGLGIAPLVVGTMFALGAVGGLLGAMVAGRVARRLGVGPAIIASILVSGVGSFLAPLATGPRPLVLAMVVATQFVVWFGLQIYNVNQVSLRQGMTPDELQGRMNATMRFLIWSTAPVGGLLGGFLGQAIGLRQTLLLSALGASAAFLWVLLSPLRRLGEQPALAPAPPVPPVRQTGE
jgi:MFS family permease